MSGPHDTPLARLVRETRETFGEDHPASRLAFELRLAEVMAEEEAAGEHGLYWLSFVDPAKAAPPGEQVPGGPGFLGACWLEADGPIHAVRRAHELGVNPGGEVATAGPLPVEWASAAWRSEWCGRLLSLAECEAAPEMDQLPPERRQ